ncbi:MAG: DUF4440 domain-containing protein [Cyclobacteriaceae bacterium]|nr:DUF4440 domain-containing protein [Cyclobacteriaceae bacterium]
MKTLVLLGSLLFLGSCQPPKPPRDVQAEIAAIRATIDASQIAWNNGDLEGFMESYWKSDSLVFYSKRGRNNGWQETLDGYRKSYSDLALMGNLHFDIMSVSPVADGVYIVLGKYTVTRKDGTLEGSFTLLFREKNGKWVAVYDHTC